MLTEFAIPQNKSETCKLGHTVLHLSGCLQLLCFKKKSVDCFSGFDAASQFRAQQRWEEEKAATDKTKEHTTISSGFTLSVFDEQKWQKRGSIKMQRFNFHFILNIFN